MLKGVTLRKLQHKNVKDKAPKSLKTQGRSI